MPFTILIVDDEREMCVSLSEILCSHGFQAIFATDPLQVPGVLRRNPVELVIMDIKMPQMSGIDLLRLIREGHHSLPVIMITGFPSIENAVRSMKYGALNFFVKPLKIRELVGEIRQIADSRRRTESAPVETRIVTRNGRMLRILDEVNRVAPTDVAVLITGETGSGKELIANAIHQRGGRAGKPLIKVNCASIPDTLLESEMFGHEKGAYTDAASRHIGKLELAHGGTIFFDEIGDMTVRTQAKLLRVLQDGEFQRLGGLETLRTDARVIAATNQDIEGRLKDGSFREDLFYRLSVVRIEVPSLRERKDDIDLLLDFFLEQSSRRYAKHIDGFAEQARELLRSHDWPGNVRELKNCIERAVIFCDGEQIGIEHLPAQYLGAGRQPLLPRELDRARESLDRQRISEALARSGGEKQKAALLLNISRKTLYNRMKKLGMLCMLCMLCML
jgi:DNA-binding NtrC family response regulator